MYCKNCGKEILESATFCPGCGCAVAENAPDNSKKKKKTPGCLISIVIIVALFLILAVIIGSGDSSDTPSDNPNTSQSTNQTQESKKTLIYEDDYIKASYIKVYSDPIVDASVEGVVYLQLLVENKSNQKLTVSLSNAAVNGMSTTIGSGMPMTILPSNSSQQPFIIFTKNTNVQKADDINKLQFSFYLMDENVNTVEETKVLTLNIKK